MPLKPLAVTPHNKILIYATVEELKAHEYPFNEPKDL